MAEETRVALASAELWTSSLLEIFEGCERKHKVFLQSRSAVDQHRPSSA